MPERKRGSLSEAQVQEQIVEWTNTVIPGMWLNRQNTGAMTIAGEGKKQRHVKFGVRGAADLTGIYRTSIGAIPVGLRIEIECKREDYTINMNNLSGHEEEQNGWLENNRHYGAIAFFTNSLDDCARKLKKAFDEKGLPWSESWSPN